MGVTVTLLLLLAVGASGGQERPLAEYDFQWLTGESVRVGYEAGDSLRASEILTFLEGLPDLAGLPPALPRGVTLLVASDEARFQTLIGAAVPEWGAAVAIPALDRIVVPASGPRRSRGWDEARVLQHEWAHLALGQYLSGLRIPRWFNEGYAEWASGGWNPTQGWRLRVAMALGQAPPLDSLTLDWPRDRSSAELAYLLSATAVEYLVSESGERGLRIFLESWRQEGSFSRALQRIYGVTPGQFEEDWKKYVRRRYGWLFVLSHSSVFWLTLALALLVLFRIRKGRQREGMARLRAGDPPDEPAYWEGTEEDADGDPHEPGH